jgi:peptidoglycan/LPS O-acetylase OafA/YrhL
MNRAAASPRSDPFGYVPAIDGLRALAIAAVMLFHLRGDRLPGGHLGVDLFFVISGFVVTASLARRTGPSLGAALLDFYARRTVRILPALLVMLVIVSFLTAYLVRGETVGLAGATALLAFVGASNFGLLTAPDDYFASGSQFNPFLHTWTLGVEEQFYLVFPLLLYLGLRKAGGGGDKGALALVLFLAALSFALWAVLSVLQPRAAFYLMPARFWELGAGAALYLSRDRWLPVLQRSAAAPMVGWAGLAAFAAAAAFPAPWGPAASGAAGALLISLACARPRALVSRALAAGPSRFVGRISYSLYLWHWPIFVLMRWTVGIETPLRAGAAILLAVAAACLSYYLVEQPIRTAARARPRRSGKLLAGAGLAVFATACVAVLPLKLQPWFASRTAEPAHWYGPAVSGGCEVAATQRPFLRGLAQEWRPKCRPRGKLRRLVVVGDSHAMAYEKLLKRFAAETGVPVVSYSTAACGFPPLREPAAAHFDCPKFRAAVAARLQPTLGPGDAVFMPALRLPHLINWRNGALGAARPPAPEALRRLKAEAEALLLPLSRTGARLVLEAPKPIFAFVPQRCSDWFNRRNIVCRGGPTKGRGALLRLREPMLGAMRELSLRVPNLAIWDPFPALCPAEPCSVYGRGGLPLYIDDDHLSGRGNDAVFDSFAAFLLEPAPTQPGNTPMPPALRPRGESR